MMTDLFIKDNMITSTSSSQVKHVCALLSRSKERRLSGEYVVEGIRMVSEVPRADLVKVYMSKAYAEAVDKGYLDTVKDVAVIVSDNVYNHMSDTKTPQGIMAIVKSHKYSLEDVTEDDSQGSPLILCVENLQDPGNLGTIIRMGEAAGATGIIISSDSADIYNPKTIRSTMGSIFRVPYYITDNFCETLDAVKKCGVKVYAAHLAGEMSYTDADYTGGTAFIIGNEGNGLTDEAAARADCLIKIPMAGRVESLNAAIACTVLSFEAARQRR